MRITNLCTMIVTALSAIFLSLPPLSSGNGDIDRLAGKELSIVSKLSGLYLDVAGQKKANGSFLIQFRNNGRLNQQYKLVPAPDGEYYFIESLHSNKRLDISSDGALVINAADGGASQQWKFIPAAGGCFTIVSRATGDVVAVKDGSTASEARIIVATGKETADQLWQIKPLYKNEARDMKSIGDADAACDFDAALAAYETAVHDYPWLDMKSVINPAARSAYFKLLESLGGDDISEAGARLDKLIEITGRNQSVKDFYKKHAYLDYLKFAVDRREALGSINPKYTISILLLYAKRCNADITMKNGNKVEVRGEITGEQRIMTDLFVGTLKNFMEISTDGNVTVKFTKEDLDADITEFEVPDDDNPNHLVPIYKSLQPYPNKILYDNVVKGKTDVIIWIFENNVRMVCHGGSATVDLGQMNIPPKRRGFVELMPKYMFLWDGCGLQLVYHEFLHALEAKARPPHMSVHFSPSDLEKWKAFGWTDMGKLETFSFQIRTFIPMKIKQLEEKGDYRGWNILSFSEDYP